MLSQFVLQAAFDSACGPNSSCRWGAGLIRQSAQRRDDGNGAVFRSPAARSRGGAACNRLPHHRALHQFMELDGPVFPTWGHIEKKKGSCCNFQTAMTGGTRRDPYRRRQSHQRACCKRRSGRRNSDGILRPFPCWGSRRQKKKEVLSCTSDMDAYWLCWALY